MFSVKVFFNCISILFFLRIHFQDVFVLSSYMNICVLLCREASTEVREDSFSHIEIAREVYSQRIESEIYVMRQKAYFLRFVCFKHRRFTNVQKKKKLKEKQIARLHPLSVIFQF